MINSCSYFDNYKCRSCTLLENPTLPLLPERLLELSQTVYPWQKCKEAFGSRAKAKMSVTGNFDNPIIGILDSELKGVELLNCPLHKKVINSCLGLIPGQIKKHKLQPYSIQNRDGLLKGLILQTNKTEDHLRLRFVLHRLEQKEKIVEIANFLKQHLSVKLSVSINIQPIAHQIPEGDEEHLILGEDLLWELYGETAVAFPAQSFMQVTPEIAEKIYLATREIIAKHPDFKLIDLFCGAGGFALSVAKDCREVTGIEISSEAVRAAKISAEKNNLANCKFIQADLTQSIELLQESCSDIVICNPPRRGLGENVIATLNQLRPKLIIYSSCNAESFLKDYQLLSNQYSLKECTPFEMFPLTRHFEVLAVLSLSNFA